LESLAISSEIGDKDTTALVLHNLGGAVKFGEAHRQDLLAEVAQRHVVANLPGNHQ
jgi:hypothetical protein